MVKRYTQEHINIRLGPMSEEESKFGKEVVRVGMMHIAEEQASLRGVSAQTLAHVLADVYSIAFKRGRSYSPLSRTSQKVALVGTILFFMFLGALASETFRFVVARFFG